MTSVTKQPRDVQDVLLRVPSALRGLVREQATETGVSQNAFITNSILFGVLVYGERQYVGEPQNLTFLVTEIDRAQEANDAAVGAFHTKDWVEVSHIVSILERCDVIANLKVRPDTRAKDTTVFSFTLTKNGRLVWSTLRRALIMAAEQADGKQEPLLMS